MHLKTFKEISKTNINFPQQMLERGTCGLFRAPLHMADMIMPSMIPLLDSVPVKNASEYEIDIKVHMLMDGYYPCIPNWHCDNVGRDENGLRYDKIDPDTPPMLLWISDGPLTEFLAEDVEMPATPWSHREVAKFINGQFGWRSRQGYENSPLPTKSLTPQTWVSMDQATPHRGTPAKGDSWRVFARVTHKSITPHRPVNSYVRRHAQVYIDAKEFSW